MSDAQGARTKPDAGVDAQTRGGGLTLNAPPFVPKSSQEQRPGLRLSSNVNAAPFVPAYFNAGSQDDSGTARSGEHLLCLHQFSGVDSQVFWSGIITIGRK